MNKLCPLCKSLLDKVASSSQEIAYCCYTRVKYDGKIAIPHFEDSFGRMINWYIPPYRVRFMDGKTQLCIYDPGSFTYPPDFKHILTLDVDMQNDTPSKVMERLTKLVIFS